MKGNINAWLAVSATAASLAALAIASRPLWAEKPPATATPQAESMSEMMQTHHQQHQEMMAQMQEMMDKCKKKMAHGKMDSSNGDAGAKHSQHGHGGTSKPTAK